MSFEMSYVTLYTFHSDIDECEEGTDGCDHNCTNTDGSYYCTCMDGYELESDNHTCTGNDHDNLTHSKEANSGHLDPFRSNGI